jgi:hypothetical protein
MALVTSNPNGGNGLVKASPLADRPAPINVVKISSPEYKGVAVDTRWVPRSALLTHIEGSSWNVDYYSQVLDTDSQLSGQQLTVNPVYQQYKKIVGMEMKVSSPLTSTQDEESKTMVMTGTATLYPFMIPNEGDMFVADIGEGNKAIFRVTASTKKSIFKEACYEITYSLDTEDSAKLANLETKTVSVVYFHKDFLNFGQNPLLIEDNHAALLEVEQVYVTLVQQYFKKFFSNEFKTLLVPGQVGSVYDHFLVDFLLSQFTTWESHEIRFIKKLTVDDDAAMRCNSLWTALKEKDVAYLNTSFKRAGLISTRVFTADPSMNGIRYTGIGHAVYPTDPQVSVDDSIFNTVKPIAFTVLQEAPVIVGQLNAMVKALNLRNLTATVDSIKPVTVDDFYVLSQAFYDNTPGQSVLESVVWKYLNGEAIDYKSLVETAKLYSKWGALEQFYYVPILMVLMKNLLQGA